MEERKIHLKQQLNIEVIRTSKMRAIIKKQEREGYLLSSVAPTYFTNKKIKEIEMCFSQKEPV